MTRPRFARPIAVFVTCILALIARVSSAQDAHDHDHDHADHAHPQITLPELSPGWSWDLEPDTHIHGWMTSGLVRFSPGGAVTLDLGSDRRIIVTHIQMADPGVGPVATPSYQLYLLSEEGRALLESKSSITSSGELTIRRAFYMDVDPESVAALGVAALDLEGRRELAARALADGPADARVLPLPVVGEAYPFDLPGADGQPLLSEMFAGQVVVIHIWTVRNRASLEVAEKLKSLRGRRGLAIIGVNFDNSLESTIAASRDQGIDWPQVHGPTAAAGASNLWNKVSFLSSLPRVFIVDRQGVLRHDLATAEGLESYIEQTLRQ